MKVLLNRKPVVGPWGGGNKSVRYLYEKLKAIGHEVTFCLDANDIDIIFCFDPRPNQYGEWYQDFLAYRELYGCKIIQRVGDLGTHSKPELTTLVKQSVELSDHVIFLCNWSREWLQHQKENNTVIHNAPLKVFHENKRHDLNPNSTIKLVTPIIGLPILKKRFDFYQNVDQYLQG